MAVALPFIAAGAAVFSAVQGAGAASDAKRQGRNNARMEVMKTDEEARRLGREQRDVESTSRAVVAASGTTGQGSQDLVLKDMKAEHSREMRWLKTVGVSNANLARTEGRNASTQATIQAVSNIGSAAMNMYSVFGPKS